MEGFSLGKLNGIVANINSDMDRQQAAFRKAKQIENGYANIFYEQLVKAINDFDKELNQEEEVGVRLVSYGQTVQFHITDLGYQDPYLIYFFGELEDGSPIQLIQNVNQISFVLIAMKRKQPEEPKKPIGFSKD